MKRVLIAVACSVMALSAMAINTEVKHGDRIGVLMISQRNAPTTDVRIAEAVLNYLRDELQTRGFDAFRVPATVDTLRLDERPTANYYVEILESHADTSAVGGVGVSAGPVGGEIGMVVGHVAAVMRVYDAKTMSVVDEFDLSQKHKTVAPTGVGIRGFPIVAWIAVPIAQHTQIRAATHAVAREAADRIAAGAHGGQ